MVNEKAKGYRLGSLQWKWHFFKIGVEDGEGEGEGNVRTYKILGSLEILAIKNWVGKCPLCPPSSITPVYVSSYSP